MRTSHCSPGEVQNSIIVIPSFTIHVTAVVEQCKNWCSLLQRCQMWLHRLSDLAAHSRQHRYFQYSKTFQMSIGALLAPIDSWAAKSSC